MWRGDSRAEGGASIEVCFRILVIFREYVN